MATDYTIGVGGDYTTINSWLSALSTALGDNLAGQGRQRGRLLNQQFDEQVLISGFSNPSADDYIELTVDTGASFADNEANRLDFVESQGAWIDWTGGSWTYGVNLQVQYTRMTRVQIRRGGANEYGVNAAENTSISQCIIQGRNRPFTPAHASNCLIIMLATGDTIICRSGSQTQLQYITANCPANDKRSRDVLEGTYTTPRVKNLAGFGQSDLYNISNVSGDSTTNASDTTGNLTGSDLTNVTYTQTEPFVNGNDGPTLDFKIFSGSALEGAGQPSEVTIDIFGRPRPSSNPSIGCHESQSVGPGPEPSGNALIMGSNF